MIRLGCFLLTLRLNLNFDPAAHNAGKRRELVHGVRGWSLSSRYRRDRVRGLPRGLLLPRHGLDGRSGPVRRRNLCPRRRLGLLQLRGGQVRGFDGRVKLRLVSRGPLPGGHGLHSVRKLRHGHVPGDHWVNRVRELRFGLVPGSRERNSCAASLIPRRHSCTFSLVPLVCSARAYTFYLPANILTW